MEKRKLRILTVVVFAGVLIFGEQYGKRRTRRDSGCHVESGKSGQSAAFL